MVDRRERLFIEEGRVTYDQFAPYAAELLERSEVVCGRFSYAHPLILVDEFRTRTKISGDSFERCPATRRSSLSATPSSASILGEKA